MAKGLELNRRFYDFDLWVFNYLNQDNKEASPIIASGNINSNAKMSFVYVKSGKILFNSENEKKIIEKDNIVLFKQFHNTQLETIPNVDAHIILFSFASSLFQPCEESLLRLFNYDDGKNFLDLNLQKNKDIILSLLDRTQHYLKRNFQKGHFVGILKMILSELCVDFDTVFPEIAKKYSKDYDAKIYDYICKHFNKNISAQQVADTFFVSKGYINNLCKRFYNMPYRQMIIDIRMWYAKGLLARETNITLKKVAELCGYKEYSAFFKAYSKTFGTPPKIHKPKHVNKFK